MIEQNIGQQIVLGQLIRRWFEIGQLIVPIKEARIAKHLEGF